MDWKQVEDTQLETPKAVEDNGFGTVYLRRNIRREEKENNTNSNEKTSVWKYDEIQMKAEDYNKFKALLENPLYNIQSDDISKRLLDIEILMASVIQLPQPTANA